MSLFNLEALNAEQRKAVLLGNNNALILAGAGSGKTRVLTHRIAYLCQDKNISPLNILAVTFTNKAAKEMRARIEQLMGFSTKGMWIGTFHGIAHRLLRQHAAELGFDRRFKVLDQEDQLQLIKKVIQALNIDDKRYPPKYLQSVINSKKDEGFRALDLSHEDIDHIILKIYQAYEIRLKADNALDFSDLLLYAYELLSENDILAQHYQKRFQYILVDEFQDTNTIQYRWLDALKSSHNTMMAVGDDDQSIYAWRGAKVGNIQRFIDEQPNVEVVRLEQNYRSSQTILNAANAVIKNNQDRMGKTLWSKAPLGDKILLYEAFNERDEAEFIAGKIQTLQQSRELPLKSISILYRSNAQSRVIEEALLKYAIPYRIYGGLRFFDRAEIKDALAYMRLAAFTGDNLAFERVINVPTRGIGAKTLDNIRQYAADYELSLWQASHEMIVNKQLPVRARSALLEFMELINAMAIQKDSLDLSQFVRYVINHSGLLAMYQQSRSEKATQKVDNLKELVNAAAEFMPPIEVVDDQDLLLEFLSFAVLESTEMQADEHTDCVQMMTLHAAKGLEFPYVFITGLEDGLFPSSRAVTSDEKLAEERRLCYVGITRAMKNLTLSYSKVRYQYGDVNYQTRSRFLHEIPSECLHNVRTLGQNITQSKNFGAVPFDFVKPAKNKSAFNMGEFVNHPKFGIGVFLKAEGEGDNLCYHVDFKASGSKKVLLAKLAKLSKL